MEVANTALLQSLRHDSLSFTPKETARLADALRTVYALALSGAPIDPYVPLVMTHCFVPDVPHPLKKWAYVILREVVGRLDVDWAAVLGNIEQDLGKDSEFLADALRFVSLLPVEDAVRLITSRESELAAYLKTTANPRTAAMVTEALCPLLLKLWEESDTPGWRDVVRELFRQMIILAVDESPAWSRLGWFAFAQLVAECEKRPCQSDLASACGSSVDVYDGLVSYALDLLLPNTLLLIDRANGLTLHDASLTVPCLTVLLRELKRVSAGAVVRYREVDCDWERVVQHYFETLVRALLDAPDPALHLLLAQHIDYWPRSDQRWELACKLVAASASHCYSAVAFLRCSAALLPDFSPEDQSLLAACVLERSITITEKVDKFAVLLSSFRALVRAAKCGVWTVFTLLSFPWFVSVWTQQTEVREEVLACLATACCMEREATREWLQTALEAADLGIKVLDWRCLSSSFAPDCYFSLLEEVCVLGPQADSSGRVQLLLETIAQRFDGSGWNESPYTKCLALEVLSRFWEPKSEGTFSALLTALQHRLADTRSMQESPLQTELLAKGCLSLATRFHLQCGSSIVQWLQDLVSKLDSPKLEPAAEYVGKVLTAITRHQLGETAAAEDSMDVNEGLAESGESRENEESLDVAVNAQRSKACLGTNVRPLSCVRILRGENTKHWQCNSSVQITGLADVVLVQATHILEPRQ